MKKDIDACFFKKKPALYLCLTTQNRAGYINNKNSGRIRMCSSLVYHLFPPLLLPPFSAPVFLPRGLEPALPLAPLRAMDVADLPLLDFLFSALLGLTNVLLFLSRLLFVGISSGND